MSTMAMVTLIKTRGRTIACVQGRERRCENVVHSKTTRDLLFLILQHVSYLQGADEEIANQTNPAEYFLKDEGNTVSKSSLQLSFLKRNNKFVLTFHLRLNFIGVFRLPITQADSEADSAGGKEQDGDDRVATNDAAATSLDVFLVKSCRHGIQF